MKIYVFDIDGNLLRIPTKFYMQDIETLKMLTYEASESGNIIGNMEKLGIRFYIKESYSMRNFRGKLGDKMLFKDIDNAEFGPSWADFVECINTGSFFGVITGRGNSSHCLRKVFKNMILGNLNGLNVKHFVEHIKRNTVFVEKETRELVEKYSDIRLLEIYLKKYCFFYARNSKETIKRLNLKRAMSMATTKLIALKDFETRMEEIVKGVCVDEMISLGFSDDEESNCRVIREYFKNDHKRFERQVYITSGGKRLIYEPI